MKVSIKVVGLCAALAFALTGCKYSGAGKNGNATSADGVDSANGADIVTDTVVDEEGKSVTELPWSENPDYERCTDVSFAPVYFGFNASVLQDAEMAKIEAVADHLKVNDGRVVSVDGNCDERGSNEYNLMLGHERANAISAQLARLGIDPARVQTKSHGEENPAVQGTGEDVWAKNRRGEFEIYKHK